MENKYKTKDLYEAAALYCFKESAFLGLQSGLAGQFFFIFEADSFCRELSQKYWQKQLQVTAKDYAEAVRSLKDMVFAQK